MRVCVCVCVCTLGEKKRIRGQELRRGGRERQTVSWFRVQEAADIPRGECSAMCNTMYQWVRLGLWILCFLTVNTMWPAVLQTWKGQSTEWSWFPAMILRVSQASLIRRISPQGLVKKRKIRPSPTPTGKSKFNKCPRCFVGSDGVWDNAESWLWKTKNPTRWQFTIAIAWTFLGTGWSSWK